MFTFKGRAFFFFLGFVLFKNFFLAEAVANRVAHSVFTSVASDVPLARAVRSVREKCVKFLL